MEKVKVSWPGGCRAAVSLTYDDGNLSHPRVVAPLLEKHNLRGTFYVPIMSDLRMHPQTWREMALNGHEIGNHTLFHPCRSEPGAEMKWLDPVYNLCGYTSRRWTDEVDAANFTLHLLDGKTERTFGNTCYHTTIGVGENIVNLEPFIQQRFVAARGERTDRPVNLSQINYYNLGTAGCDFRTFREIEDELNHVLEEGGWIIYTGHGVGKGSHNLYSELEEHTRLVEYLAANRRMFWTAPLIEVVQYLQRNDRNPR
jgi:sialate O-acetylesterase